MVSYAKSSSGVGLKYLLTGSSYVILFSRGFKSFLILILEPFGKMKHEFLEFYECDLNALCCRYDDDFYFSNIVRWTGVLRMP